MLLSALTPPAFALLLFFAGALAGRALAGLMRKIAHEGGYPSTRYYSLGGHGLLASCPILGHFAAPRGSRCPRLLLLEVAGGLAASSCWFLFPAAKALCGILFLLALLGAFFIDLDHMIIPDLFTVGLAIAGLILSAICPALHGFVVVNAWTCARSVAAAMLGMAVGSAILLWFSLIGEMVLGKEVLGFGDVKFLGAVGAFCGWQGAVFAIFVGAFFGLAAVVVGRIHRLCAGAHSVQLFGAQAGGGQNGRVGCEEHFPFGPMLASAAALYFLALHPAADRFLARYLTLF